MGLVPTLRLLASIVNVFFFCLRARMVFAVPPQKHLTLPSFGLMVRTHEKPLRSNSLFSLKFASKSEIQPQESAHAQYTNGI
jgi:hypothetical protein